MDKSPKFTPPSPEEPSEAEIQVMMKGGSVTVLTPGRAKVEIPVFNSTPIIIYDSTAAGAAKKALDILKIRALENEI